MLILPVRLAVVADDPVGVGRWLALRLGRSNLSVEGVVKPPEETFAQVHVTDRVDALREVDAARHLTVVMSPVVLDALHVPLVDDHDDFLLRALVNGLEEVLITLVDRNAFDGREEDIHRLNEPVDHVRVDTPFGELGRLSVVKARNELFTLLSIEADAHILQALV